MTGSWAALIPESDWQVYRAAGFGESAGLGRRPALLVIDVQYRSMGFAPRPILEAIEEFPTSCGDVGWRAVPHIAALIESFRRKAAPVIYPCVARKDAHAAGGFAAKVPGILSIPDAGYDFVREIAPRPGDLVIAKAHASAFFGTALASHLVRLGVDSLVLAGCTTSGCVRATAVDACSLNYPVVVAEESVYDRGELSHAVSLFDMANKYADVVPMSEATRMIDAAIADPQHV
jgi:maleamate amidohydrolase